MELHKKREKVKILKALERGSTRLARDWYVDIASFCRWHRKAARPLLTYLLTGRFTSLTLPYSPLPSYLTPFLLTLLYCLLPFYWDKNNLSFLASFLGRKYSKTIPNCVLAKIQSHLFEKMLRQIQIASQPNSNRISSRTFYDNFKLCLCQISLFSLIYSILMPSE